MASKQPKTGNSPKQETTQNKPLTQENRARGKISTQESVFYDTQSSIGMATTMFKHSRSHNFDLAYDVKITFVQENIYGAKLYKDCFGRYAVKIEDYASHLELALWVNYQGDRYMGRDGTTYLFVDNPDVVDKLGDRVPREEPHLETTRPRPAQLNFKMVNTIVTKRVLITDETRALYKRTDSGIEFFYHRQNPLKHSLTNEKVLYVLFNKAESCWHRSVIFMDSYGQEWDLLLKHEIGDFTHLGRSINQEGDSSTARQINHMLGMETPTIRSPTLCDKLRPATTRLRSETTPEGIENTNDKGGNPAIRGPTEPLHSSSHHAPSEERKNEPVVSIQDMTTAQEKPKEQAVEEQGNVPSKNKKKSETWKERKARRAASRQRQNKKDSKESEIKGHILGPMPLNKPGHNYEGEAGNPTLPVEHAGHSIMAILDCGAGVSVVTKKVWDTWGKPALRKTGMKLQLADGNIKEPIGLLEQVRATTCGIQYEHTFAIIDFGKCPHYDIILGRPFMRQMKMIHDWGSDHIYLQQHETIIRVNLTDHSCREVSRTPVEDFASNSTGDVSVIPSWINSRVHRWVAEVTKDASLDQEHSANKMVFHGEDCNLVPLHTIGVVSTSEDSSDQSQQNMSLISHDIELEFNIRLKFQRENIHGAKIYKDFIGRYVVKIEDQASDFDPAPCVNYQGDRFMGMDASVYFLVENPESVDSLGYAILEEPRLVKEEPPIISKPGLTYIYSIRAQKVLIDDTTKAIYKQHDTSNECFYLRDLPPEYTLTEDKIMSVYANTTIGEPLMKFFDEFGMEWGLMLENEVNGVTYMGLPITRRVHLETETTGSGLGTPVAIPSAVPRTPPTHFTRPPPGFDPRLTSQTMLINEYLMKCEGQVMGNQELSMQDQRMFPQDPIIPTIEGSSYYQPSPHNERAIQPVSASNSKHNMHYTHQEYRAPTATTTSYTQGRESSIADESSSLIVYNQQTLDARTNTTSLPKKMGSHSPPIESFSYLRHNESQRKIKPAQSGQDPRFRPNLSYPPGFSPKVFPQPMAQSKEGVQHASSTEIQTTETHNLSSTTEKIEPRLVGMRNVEEWENPLMRDCEGCGITHLFKDCPLLNSSQKMPL